MKLNKIPKNELDLLSYKEIAKMYLQENKTTMNTADLFKEICNLLELSENEYVDKIADFFESLTTSKEFILLEDGKWDLKSNHKVKIVMMVCSGRLKVCRQTRRKDLTQVMQILTERYKV